MEVRSNPPISKSSSLRRNGAPTVSEKTVITAQVESNKNLIASLGTELELRQKNVHLASASVQVCSEYLNYARRRWEEASSYLNGFSPIHTTLQDTLTRLDQEKTARAIVPCDFPTSKLPDDITQVQEIGIELSESFVKAIGRLSVITQEAESSYLAAQESYQVALVEFDLANNSVATIEDVIGRVGEAIRLEENALKSRKMWKLPPETWAQIFTELALPDKRFPSKDAPMPANWPHGTRAMLLASVCRTWRQLCIGQNSLWATVNIATNYDLRNTVRGLVPLYIERKAHLPGNVIMNVDRGLWLFGEWLEEASTGLGEPHRLHVGVQRHTKDLVGYICGSLPLPAKLILETSDPSQLASVHLPIGRESRMKKLLLSFVDITPTCQAELTHISLNYGDREAHRDLHVMAPNTITSLQHAVLRHASPFHRTLEPRITLPSLEHLEINLALLVNRFHSIYCMPNLRKLVIISMGVPLEKGWSACATELGKETQMEVITVFSMDEVDIEEVISHIGLFPGLLAVELRGESLGRALCKLHEVLKAITLSPDTKKLAGRLKEVVIADYSGDGTGILEFVWSYEDNGRQIAIRLLNCPNIMLDARSVCVS